MDIDFESETTQGTIQFKGTLTKDEIDFLLKFAILSLMARGSLPVAYIGEEEGNDTPPSPENIN